MKTKMVLGSLLVCASALATSLTDFAQQWPVTATKEGAYAVALDASIYRQLVQRDLSDLVAFNAQGQALAFGPMPASYAPSPSVWRQAVWFALPTAAIASGADDLSLHITRSAVGELSLDATLKPYPKASLQHVLIDVRAKDQDIEAIAFDLAPDASDFSAEVSVEASDDLHHWRTLVPVAMLAQLHQNEQSLLRQRIELPPQRATFLRIRTLGADQEIPLSAVRLLLRATQAVRSPPLQWLDAQFVRTEGRAYVYRLPAPILVEQLNIVLGEDNSVANFSVNVRDAGDKNWAYEGQLTAFRLRGAGLSLDNETMQIATTRQPEWRIESPTDLNKIPVLKFAYRPETWLLLTHGKAPYVVAAGSSRARRGEFPLTALVGQAQRKYGQNWRPTLTTLGPQQEAGGKRALRGYNRDQIKTWLLWGVLLLGAGVVVVMVLHLLKNAPPKN